jgi:DNA replication and repair protein RecF
MWIEKLTIKNCRVIENSEIDFSPQFNIIVGDNGSGKSSLIEALTLLSSGRSFRTSRIKELISYHKESVLITSRLRSGHPEDKYDKAPRSLSNNHTQIGIDKKPGKTRIRINQRDIQSQSELSRYLPVTVIHPDSIKLIIGSPSERRAFIDWISFYSFPDFYSLWKRYKHILKQRNLCLKLSSHRYALDQWTRELVSLQAEIHDYRFKSIKLLNPVLSHICTELLGSMDVKLVLKSGFPTGTDLEKNKLLEFYKAKEVSDLKAGRTMFGVHRSDINILIDDVPAIQCASRGQLKLLAVSLFLAQSKSIKVDDQSKLGVIIIDDLAAELDHVNKEKLLQFLIHLNQQLILTTTQISKLPLENAKVFHVKHGRIESV